MRTRMLVRRVAAVAAGALVLLLAAGCVGKSKDHKEAVNAANQRWREVRSGLILQMAQRQFDTGDLDQAERSVRDALGADPGNARIYLLMGRIQLERGMLERSFNELESAIRFDPRLAAAHYYQGVVLQRWQRNEAALERYSRAYELEADNAAYLLARADMLVLMGRADQAQAVLEDKLTYFDQNASVRLAVAQVLVIRGRPAEAVGYYRQAALLKPDDLQLREEMAETLIDAGLAAEAVPELERLLEQPEYRDRRDVALSLARALVLSDRLGDARARYIALTRSEPGDVETWIKLGEVCWMIGDAGGSLSAAQRVIGLAPQRSEGYLMAGMVRQKQRRTDEAIALFDRAARVAPKDPMPLILRGMALQDAGRTTAAAQAYAQALERSPGDERVERLLRGLAPASDRSGS